jgi:hypothetical protein
MSAIASLPVSSLLNGSRGGKEYREEEWTSAMQIDQLKAAVAAARTLIEFAITSDRRVEDKVVDAVLQKIAGLGDLAKVESVPLEKEAEFWKAYQGLAQATLPVSAASIGASQRAARSWLGTTGRHSLIAALVFIVFAALQVTWVVGTTLRGDLDQSEKAFAALEEKRRPVQSELRTVLAELEHLNGDDGQEQTQQPRKVKLNPEVEKKLRELKDKGDRLQEQLGFFDQDMNPLRNKRDPVVELIGGWYSLMTLNRWPIATDNAIAKLTEQKTDLEKRRMEDKREGIPPSVFFVERRGLDRQLERARDQRVVELKHRADTVLGVLQRYAFPVLLGLLGALTYILRTLIVQIREFSYTSNFSSMSLVRVSLGMMAGLLGGMLIPQTDNVLKSVPPLALPFLFGYAVEVVFTFLDRIVKAFVDERVPAK